MAKWGEGDPRWIVEERPDATNVNNWHWTEKNAAPWSKEKLKTLLMGVVVNDPAVGKCYVTDVTSMEGEAVANNRKGKLIFFYEWVIQCDWKGLVNGNADAISGKLEIPNLSEENSAEDITIDVSVESTDKGADLLKEMMRVKGLVQVQAAVGEYMKALRNEFARDMIKPTKLDDGGINSFTTDEQIKEKARQNAQEIKKPTLAPQPAPKSTAGVKIDTSTLTFKEYFKCTSEEFYRVLTDQTMLQAFTGNKVLINPSVGGRFELLDGNIHGKFLQLTPNSLIKQEWRIRNWPDAHFSEVTIEIEQKEDTTEVSISQKGVPCLELERTKEGWKRYYFESIRRTFGFGATMF